MQNSAIRLTGPGRVDLVPCPTDPLGAGQVRVRTRYSGISTGTELTLYRGSNPGLTKRWDADRRMFLDRAGDDPYPLLGWGYEEVGQVVEVAPDVSTPSLGDLVWGIWGHRTEAVLPAAAVTALPPDADPLAGVFARPGAIALNAVIAAGLSLGEWAGVFGQGVIGLLATRLATLSGARVVAVDPVPARLKLAERFGARRGVDPSRESAATVLRALSAGAGADACVELSGSYPALHEAIRATALAGRVVAAGFYQGEAAGLALGEEFHHNRIQLISAQVSGPAPVPHAVGRWPGVRVARTFMELVAEGRVDPLPLVTHVMDATDVAEAFALLDGGAPEAVQVVLRFS
ncbi:MAG TPA: zinc-binding dehydrogenase [Micromonosporaceae bacterium]|nr:zinc-binding dehydrogenase [Micromonosporaceae bacterium]